VNIAVIGTGYVGLVSGTCFAETGNNVTCIDIDISKIDSLKKGIIPIFEPGLHLLFERNIKQNRLKFTTSLNEGIKDAELIFLALPTPAGEDGAADLSYVLKATTDLSELITEYTVVVNKSTVPIGTAQKVSEVLAKKLDSSLFDVVSNPEFLREGVAINDFMKPDRVVIGTTSDRAKKIMKRLYDPFVRQGNPIYFMDERSAEMTKYAANSFLATKISFMNEIANLCELTNANVDQVRIGIGSDSRIGKRFLFPGVGYGGSCFPKDVQALAKTAEENMYDFKILKSVMEVNLLQRESFVTKILKYYRNNIENKTFGVWGLAFKPNTDDIREAPSIDIIKKLLQNKAQVKVFDPEAMENVEKQLGDKVMYCKDQYDAIDDVDALLIITEWQVFRTPSFKQVKDLLKEPVIFDGRNLYDTQMMKENGFYYESIGRPVNL